ncbi:MAG: hypothetical protein AAFO29_07445, partial [Actinomycetota bacterium]
LDDDRVQVGDLYIALANLRARWNQLDSAARLPWLRETLPALVSPPPIPERLQTTRPLRPGVRPRSMLESARLANLTNEVAPEQFHQRSLIPHADFGADLVTVLLWDTPATMSVIDNAQLDDWEADFDDLLPVAIDNLEELPENGWTSMYKQVYSSLDEDDYAGARMLRPGYLDSTGLSGELVVLHPNRCRLIVAAVDDARGIAKACERVFEDIGAPSPVSLRPLVGRPGNWRPLAVPPSHPAHEMWQRLCHLNDQMIHNSLRQPLQTLLGHDVSVGSYDIVEGSDGAYHSVTTWTEGVPSLLPRTELINLVNDWGTVTAPWDEVRQLVGPLIEPTEHYPELWRVVDFPRPQDLTKLRHRAGA